MTEQLHAIVRGRVQGVSFRQSTYDVARRLGLVGEVHNLYDGSVEVTAEGEREALEKLLEWLHQGPPAARVAFVSAEWGMATNDYDEFSVSG
ncbi:MAG: acylphosphatase [Anaerolineae bacterium]|nr:acylphosphatase [Anaerolineae bacterium]